MTSNNKQNHTRNQLSLFRNRLVLASHNAGKLREIADLLVPYAISVVSAKALNLPEPEETGISFSENAQIKAGAAAQAADLPALADDSGLAVAALNGGPGIYSARWAGRERNFKQAMQKVEQALISKSALAPEQRKAEFVCVLCLAWPDGHFETFTGRISGHIVWPPRGDKGFGYDPIFLPDGHTRTFGEMTPQEKHGPHPDGSPGLSHRARAFYFFQEKWLNA